MDQERPGASPLDELKRLDEQVEEVTDLAGLKPIFYRLDDISKQFSGDFEVQLGVADVKQHLVNRGMRLKEALTAGASPSPGLNTPLPEQTSLPNGPGAGTSGSFAVSDPHATGPQPPEAGGLSGQVPSAQFPSSSKLPPVPLVSSQMPTMNMGQPPTPTPPPAKPPAVPPPAGGQPAPAGAAPAQAPPNWKRAVGLGAIIGVVLFAAFVVLIQLARHRNMPSSNAPAGTVPVDITTVPPGAAIRINNEVKCTSNCRLNLTPGNYTITALLDGYEPVASGVTVTAGSAPLPVSMTLQPQPQTVRLFADEPGRVVLDDQPPKDLQEGQLILDGVTNGKHVVKVTTRSGESTFTFDVAAGKPPTVEGPVTAKNLIAVIVTGSGGQAHLTSATPLKIELDGKPEGEAGPGGLDLNGVTPGDHDLSVGEGKDQKKLVVSFGPAPMLTAFLKSNVNAGTLVVSTGEDDASVFLNNKEYRHKTQRGQLRIQWLGNVSVRVSKPGFQDVPAQQATVQKGEETRLEFTLKPLPKMAVLQIRGGAPGTQVLLDQQNVGTIGPDGTFSHAKVSPGEHNVELRREHFNPKKLTRNFKAGETVALGGSDVILTASLGSVQVAATPANASISYRHADEPQTFEVKGNSVQLPTGVYTFTATAPGFSEASERVVVIAGETRNVELRLSPEKAAPVIPIGTMADWRQPRAWQKNEDGLYVHKGGNFVQYKITPTAGTFQFTVELLKGGGFFHGGRIRWFLNYRDSRNYALFEMDKRALVPKDVVDGKSNDREKAPHDEDPDNRYTMEIQVMPGRVITRMRVGKQWAVLDDWKDPARDFSKGTFGFYIPGNDEIGLADFRFTPAK